MASAENTLRYRYCCKYCGCEVFDKDAFKRHKKEKHWDEVSRLSRTCSETSSKNLSESVLTQKDVNGASCASRSLFSVFSNSTESTPSPEGSTGLVHVSTAARIGSLSRVDKENSGEVADASVMVHFNSYDSPTPTRRSLRRRQREPANTSFTPKRSKIIAVVPYGMLPDPNAVSRVSGG